MKRLSLPGIIISTDTVSDPSVKISGKFRGILLALFSGLLLFSLYGESFADINISNKDGYNFRKTVYDKGAYILAGNRDAKGVPGNTACVMKLDKDGNKVWEIFFGGSRIYFIRDIAGTVDNGFIVTGSSTGKGAKGKSGWIIKINAAGAKLWERFHGPDTVFNTAIETGSGDYFAAGSDGEKGIISGYGRDGKDKWKKTYGDKYRSCIDSLIKNEDGSVTAAGSVVVLDEDDEKRRLLWILGIKPDGTRIYEKIPGIDKPYDPDALHDSYELGTYRSFGIQSFFLAGNGYMVSGNSYDYFAGSSTWIFGLDAEFNEKWKRVYDALDRKEVLCVLSEAKDAFIAGYHKYNEKPKKRAWIAGLDMDGNITWEKEFDAAGKILSVFRADAGYSMIVRQDNGFFLKELKPDGTLDTAKKGKEIKAAADEPNMAE